MTGFILAIQFLTRLPTPQIAHFQPDMLPQSARWFPLVGLLMGGLLWLLLWPIAQLDLWLAAWLGVAFWTIVTGALHLDGLADMTDGMGAAHRDPERLLAVMKDPHLGSFGVLSLILQSSGKLVLLMLLLREQQWAALLLIPAWARCGIYLWQRLPPLGSGGLAERFSWSVSGRVQGTWLLLLLALSGLFCPILLAAPLLIGLYFVWLKQHLGAVSGDCLGAGVELSELCLLLLVVVAALLQPATQL